MKKIIASVMATFVAMLVLRLGLAGTEIFSNTPVLEVAAFFVVITVAGVAWNWAYRTWKAVLKV